MRTLAIESRARRKEIEEGLANDSTVRHYLAIEKKGRAERTVGHAVLSLPNLDFINGWYKGISVSSGQERPKLIELRGTAVDPSLLNTGIKSRLIQSRIVDATEEWGAIAVAAIHEEDAPSMCKVEEFGGRIASQEVSFDGSPVNLVVFPPIDRNSLLYTQ